MDFVAKRAALADHLKSLERVAIAFSGGVDSSALLAQAHAVLGAHAVAVIADSPSLPRRELAEAQRVAESIGAHLIVVRTDEAQDPSYQANSGNRCYFCKRALFVAMERVCREQAIPWMAFGEITDDWSDHRPGAQAAKEFGVVAPLSQAGMDKQDVRRLAAEFGLVVADKPASACLASRIPVGTKVTLERLRTVEGAEDSLLDLAFGVLRVRHHGNRARVEVSASQLPRALALRTEIEQRLVVHGFESVEFAEYPTR
ncbi:MAG: ATP-dependent sacrificial sulfur transferase LarE [Planctomycetes bacterium]|nr:ATP-dependent sacrificial sulfur transferase LarE [Planctomycetota bacterium]HPF14731.1 ATP-dependent sacrificial sulfur transferase LarE [Planctomycetota bacterium]